VLSGLDRPGRAFSGRLEDRAAWNPMAANLMMQRGNNNSQDV
jgi:hypothetical protein